MVSQPVVTQLRVLSLKFKLQNLYTLKHMFSEESSVGLREEVDLHTISELNVSLIFRLNMSGCWTMDIFCCQFNGVSFSLRSTQPSVSCEMAKCVSAFLPSNAKWQRLQTQHGLPACNDSAVVAKALSHVSQVNTVCQ